MKKRAFLFCLFWIFLPACTSIRSSLLPLSGSVCHVKVIREGQTESGSFPAGKTVQDVLQSLKISWSSQDIIEPSLTTIISDGITIRIRVITTQDDTQQSTIPFESQTIRNETLPEGEQYLIQTGKNGLQKVTTHSVYEDGVLVSQNISDRSILTEAIPEILMLGAKAEYAPIQIPGRILYISEGNLWLMQNSTENRTPLVMTGDLDGNILDLSSNAKWVLFTRKTRADSINSLWMLDITDSKAQPISLRISNVIHYAQWLPGDALRVLYSTVTPQENAPGWKAANDLLLKIVSDSGMILSDETIIPANEDGLYSWWGTEFQLSADGRQLIYATPSEIGSINRLTSEKTALIPIQPYEKTRSDWAWIPGTCWSSNGKDILFAYHGDISGKSPSYDPADFNIGLYSAADGKTSVLASSTGLFSYPAASPLFSDGSSSIAYLQAVSPKQSENSQYRIMLMDPDGKNPKKVYPLDESGTILPQKIVWAPSTDKNATWIGFISQGNIWLVNPYTGIYNQITVDQSATKLIWK